MKIRTDFVTNSSSSSFTVALTVFYNGGSVQVSQRPTQEYEFENGSESGFEGDLHDINNHLTSVEELATWLVESLYSDSNCGWGGARKIEQVEA